MKMAKNLVVKELGIENLSAVLQLQDKIIENLHEDEKHFILKRSVDDFMKALDSESTHMLGVFDGDKLVAQSIFDFPQNGQKRDMPEFAGEEANDDLVIYKAILVDSDYRGTGLMKNMLDFIEKKAVDAGTFGKIQHAMFRRLSSRPEWAWEGWLHQVDKSGGVAVDMHVHDVDFVRYIMGEPDVVKAHAHRDAEGVIQQINAVYGYGDKVSVAVESGWDYPADFPFTADFRVKFDKATVIGGGGVVNVYPLGGAAYQAELEEEFQGDNEIGGNISSLGGYYNELKYFVEGLQGKNDLSVATVSEAIKSVQLVKREIEAAGGLIVK